MLHPYSKKSKRILWGSADQPASLCALENHGASLPGAYFWTQEEPEGNETYQGHILLDQ